MSRKQWTITTVLVLVLTAILTPVTVSVVMKSSAQAAASNVYHMPIVKRDYQPVPVTLTTLVDHDCGFVIAESTDDGRIFIGYQDRTQGSKFFIAEDMGNRIVPVPDPTGQIALMTFGITNTQQIAPSFAFPGPKQGPGDIIVIGSVMHIYSVTRNEDDPTGPFYLKRLTMNVPPRPVL